MYWGYPQLSLPLWCLSAERLRMNVPKLCSLVFVLASMHLTAKAERQGEALLQLRLSLKASKNQLLDWIPQNVETCTWEGIRCDKNSNVVQVELNSMGFEGQLSPEIGVLENLEVLSLRGNSITGGIPEEYGNLISLKTLNLEVLSLRGNSITGGIPEEYGNLISLKTLNLENNCLNGKIPSSLGKLQNLQKLYLSQNNFDGSIPDSFTNITNLTDIRLAYNNLTGKIPDKLFKIPLYNFSGNKLNCDQGYQHSCVSAQLNQGGSHNYKTKFILGSIGAAASFLLTGFLFLLYKALRKSHKNEVFFDVSGEDNRRVALGSLRRFTWRELQMATENFSEKNVVGQGGYGRVYRGVLQGNENIAVKQFKDGLSPFTESSFQRELEMISIAAHRNLLKLIGFCTTPSERLLVYPFMPNLSVAYHLRELKPEDPVLDWDTRWRVAEGTARALAYLHESCDPKIIHRDVKAANVLLDESFEPVVGDLGLAKLVDMKKTSVTTLLHGTMGHIAPEYIATGRASEKTDVFGYGVMLLELVTGQSAMRFEAEGDLLLLHHVRKMEGENRLSSIVDLNLRENCNLEEVEMMIKIALLCTQNLPHVRPAMARVLQMLEEGRKSGSEMRSRNL